MGKLEKHSQERARREHLQKIVLGTIKVAGILSVGLLAPSVIGAMDKLGLLPKSRQREYITSSAAKLTKRGLLKYINGHYELTKDGEKILRQWELSDYIIHRPKKWDKKWRVVIFDIPEKKRKTRDKITILFRQAGFQRLQDSVWVFPYDCEDIIGLLKTDFHVGKYLLYMIVEELENDKQLRKDFNLIR